MYCCLAALFIQVGSQRLSIVSLFRHPNSFRHITAMRSPHSLVLVALTLTVLLTHSLAEKPSRRFSEPEPEPVGEPQANLTWRQRLSDPRGFSAPYYNPKNYTVSDFHTLVEGLNKDFHEEMQKVDERGEKISREIGELKEVDFI